MSTNRKKEVYVMSTGGAGDSITGSCNILGCQINGKMEYVGVDCGISQGKEEIRNEKFPIDGENITAFVITHAHTDHMGGIAMLKNFNGKIYGTKQALTIGYELLYDSVYQNIRRAAESIGLSIDVYYDAINKLETMKRHNSNSEEQKDLEDVILEIEQAALYNYEDLERIRKCFCYIEPLKRFVISNGIYGRLVPDSHQLGAVAVEIYVGELNDEDSVNISFSGDIGPKDSLLYKKLTYNPNEYIKYAYMEATHGTEERAQSVKEAYYQLKELVFRGIAENKPIIILTFATDRSANILYMLNSFIDAYQLSVPIFWDTPLGYIQLNHYEYFYDIGDEYWMRPLGIKPFENWELIVCKNQFEHLDALRAEGPKIVITASVFGEGGRCKDYFKEYIEDENALFIFAGWLSPDCTSYKLHMAERFNTEEPLEIHGENYMKCCETHQLLGLTSHGYYPEFIDYIERFPNLNTLILNHGERSAKEELAKRLKEDYDFNIVIPELYDDEKGFGNFYKMDAKSMKAIQPTDGFKIFEPVLKRS